MSTCFETLAYSFSHVQARHSMKELGLYELFAGYLEVSSFKVLLQYVLAFPKEFLLNP